MCCCTLHLLITAVHATFTPIQVNDAYTVLIREKKLPLSLLEDPDKKPDAKQARANLLTMQPFGDTFGPNARRKRPRLLVGG